MSKFWCVKDSVLIKEMLLAGRVVQVWAGPHVLSFLENGVQVDELRLNLLEKQCKEMINKDS
jgi:hypothetical protein